MVLSACLLALGFVALPQQTQQALPGAPGFRQVQVPAGVERPIVHTTYDVTLGRITSVVEYGPDTQALGGPLCFDNSDWVIEDTYVVTDPGQELVNWGRKNCAGASLLRRVTIAYLSESVRVQDGGPGGTLQIALYSGTRGFNSLGTEIFRRTITGLPSRTGAPIPPNNFLTLDFGAHPLPLADGNFGWGFLQLDGDTGPMLVFAPNVQLGTADAMDIYSPGPARSETYVGTFNYSGCTDLLGRGCASTWMQLDEIPLSETARTTVVNGSGVNPVLLEELFPPRIGQLWAVRVDVPNPCPGVPCSGNPDFTILMTSAAALATPIPTSFGELLIDRTLAVTPPMFGEATYFYAIPADTALVGRVLFAQAVVLPPDALPRTTLTNALRLRLGY